MHAFFPLAPRGDCHLRTAGELWGGPDAASPWGVSQIDVAAPPSRPSMKPCPLLLPHLCSHLSGYLPISVNCRRLPGYCALSRNLPARLSIARYHYSFHLIRWKLARLCVSERRWLANQMNKWMSVFPAHASCLCGFLCVC